MKLVKRHGDIQWFEEDNLKIRLEDMKDQSLVSITLNDYNICRKLMLFDFIDAIKDDLLLDIQTKIIWNTQQAFVTDKNDALELIYYIPKFIDEWNIKTDKGGTVSDSDYISPELWYGIS